jgi:hypothetical protein
MTPAVFPHFERLFKEFLKDNLEVPKSELVIPTSIAKMIDEGAVKVKVMSTDAEWFGVTYPQDKEMVTEKILAYKALGIYPFKLWK